MNLEKFVALILADLLARQLDRKTAINPNETKQSFISIKRY